jgi:hypothetical protein
MARTRKSSDRTNLAKRAKSVKKTEQSAAQPEKMRARSSSGLMPRSCGPPNVDIFPSTRKRFSRLDLENPKYADLFLPASPPGTSGVGRRLNHRLVGGSERLKPKCKRGRRRRLSASNWLRDEIGANFITLHFVFRPVWRTFLVESCNAFARFIRFAGLHVVLQRKIDIFFHRAPPELFN